MFYHSAAYGGRAALRGLCCAVVALSVCAVGAPRVRADGTGNSRTERAPGVKAPIVISDDAIDVNQAIKPEFVINVSVAGEQEPTGNYKVDPQGNVSIRYAGQMAPVAVKGMTTVQAQDAVAAYLKTYIRKSGRHGVNRGDAAVVRLYRRRGPQHRAGHHQLDSTLLDVITRAEYTETSVSIPGYDRAQ